jgi:hypothetical protein
MLGLAAHAFHLLLLVLGLVGVAYLLFPRAHASARASRRPAYRGPADATEHEQRVAALREAVRAGRLTTPGPAPLLPPATAARDSSGWRGLAVGSSVAAAGAHAAVFPHHLEEAWYLGLFFLVVTLAQAAWAGLVALDATDARVLWAGIAGSLGLIALWITSRTNGLPFGLGREPVGGWDVACAVWEIVVVGAALAGLRAPVARRARVLGRLRPTVWAWVSSSGAALVVLSLTASQH